MGTLHSAETVLDLSQLLGFLVLWLPTRSGLCPCPCPSRTGPLTTALHPAVRPLLRLLRPPDVLQARRGGCPAAGLWVSSCATSSTVCSAQRPPRRGAGNYLPRNENAGAPSSGTRLPRHAAGAVWDAVCRSNSFPRTGAGLTKSQRPWSRSFWPQPSPASSFTARLTSLRGQVPWCWAEILATRPARPSLQSHTQLMRVVATRLVFRILFPC